MGFREVELPREQLVLWSAKLDDAIAPDHPVRLFDRILHSGPFLEFRRDCLADYVLVDGRPPFDPLDLAGLYLYGMIHRIRSSRQLEAACHNRIDVKWLMRGQTPDHSTTAAFVSKHPEYLHQLFRQSIRVAMKAGLVNGEHVAVDGTKLGADAGRKSVKSESQLLFQKQKLEAAEAAAEEAEKQLEAMASACEKQWRENEQKEQQVWAEQAPVTRPADARQIKAAQQRYQKKLAKVEAALAAIQQRRERAGGDAPKPIASTTDPDARVMKDKEGKSKPGYNAQIAVDAQAGIIVAQDVNDRPEDVGQLTPMLKQVEQQTGALPRECSADSGYNNGRELENLQEMEVCGYLPEPHQNSGASKPGTEPTEGELTFQAARQGQTLTDQQWQALPRYNGKIDKSAFIYNASSDTYRCPAGHSLPVLRTSRDQKVHGQSLRLQYGGISACASCAHAKDCCTNPARGRTVNRDQFEHLREQMRERMNSPEGKSRYRLRGISAEPRFGDMKRNLGIRSFLHRGLEKVKAEFALICAVSNLKALMRDPQLAGALKTP